MPNDAQQASPTTATTAARNEPRSKDRGVNKWKPNTTGPRWQTRAHHRATKHNRNPSTDPDHRHAVIRALGKCNRERLWPCSLPPRMGGRGRVASKNPVVGSTRRAQHSAGKDPVVGCTRRVAYVLGGMGGDPTLAYGDLRNHGGAPDFAEDAKRIHVRSLGGSGGWAMLGGPRSGACGAMGAGAVKPSSVGATPVSCGAR